MKTVLSIQSHVVHGYVGGKAAIFPLQSQGWEVDNINTVHFSNHTGYGHFKGDVLETTELDQILNQLVDHLQIEYGALITGYIPNAELISCIASYITKLKQRDHQQQLLYLLDPVMGDNDYMYVDKSCVLEYRRLVSLRVADLVTPNQFELQLLSDVEISNGESLKRALDEVHATVPYVVVTSVDSQIVDAHDDGFIYCIVSVQDGTATTTKPQQTMFRIAKIESYFTGVGDLFSALLLDKFVANGKEEVGGSPFDRLSRSVNQVLTIMAKTLKLTHEMGMKQAKSALISDRKHSQANGVQENGAGEHHDDDDDEDIVGKMNDARTMKYFELKVIQARDYFSYDGPGEFEEIKF
ncbi:uncharacterized protein LODBEIA_P24390 [Lodderomyces beijingensis]|uniref:pyridoxal kinase n=1 Tax=Lodderomyces beijingensis TaxID=1775926 RepID=A0ABP0ZJA2_9ASCO